MNKKPTLRLNRVYRVDMSEGMALCGTQRDERIDISDLGPGTEFTTVGSTPSLRDRYSIIHATHLVLQFDERAVPYFSVANEEQVSVALCRDLRLVLVDVPYDGH